ncbi:MAG: hypothetical protein DWQ37_10830 [Planctomycetota bacterium]|nr:MAG: hypothetical protein DWQ37_10830 [Planctomycetota bacterium]
MSIEFRCESCGKLLRTPPGTEGKQAKCPQCGSVQTIPSESAFTPPPRDPEFMKAPAMPSSAAPPPEASANPYSSPTAMADPEVAAGGFHPSRIDLGETFSRTWQIYKSRLGATLGGALLAWFMMAVCNGLTNALIAPIGMAIGDDAGLAVNFILTQLASIAVSAFFLVGIARYTLQIARGQPAEIGQIFSGGPLFLRAFAIQLVLFVGTAIGMLLLIIPGVIVALMLSQSIFVLADHGTGVGDSLRLSMTAMKGNKLTLFALYLVTGLLAIVVIVFTCFIGFFFVVPFFFLMTAVVYLGVTGQATMLDVAAGYETERGFSATGAMPPPEPNA